MNSNSKPTCTYYRFSYIIYTKFRDFYSSYMFKFTTFESHVFYLCLKIFKVYFLKQEPVSNLG